MATKTPKPIKPARGLVRYSGLTYNKDGIAIGATDGQWFTVRAKSLEEAAQLIEGADTNETTALAPRLSAARLLRRPIGDAVRGTIAIDKATKPDEQLAQAAAARRAEAVKSAEAKLAQAEGRLKESQAKPRKDRLNGIGRKTELEDRREKVAKAKSHLREALTSYDAEDNILVCQDVTFDLALVQEALHSLGEYEAVLSVAGPYDAGVLRTATGIALVMPLAPKKA